MKKALITGITGFAGSHLAQLLVNKNEYEVFGTHLSGKGIENIAGIKSKVKLYTIDLTHFEKVSLMIKDIRPDIIFHLAASAFVADSYHHPSSVINNNATSQINLFEALILHKINIDKIIIISSANIYGIVPAKDMPIREDYPLNPDNPYSVSKITQDYLALSYYNAYHLPVVRLRPTNHIGPRLSPNISISRFAKIIAEIEKNKCEPVLSVGNLEAKRDFMDVRDIAEAYLLAVDKCANGDVYHLSTGVSNPIERILKMLLAMSERKIKVVKDPSLYRPSDVPDMRLDSSKFTKLTGWKPKISLEKSLSDTLDYWRQLV